MSGLVDAISNVVGDVAHAVGDVVSGVGKAVGSVVNSAINDPFGTLAKIGTAVFAPELLPLVGAADAAAHGADIGQILTSAATSYAGGQVISGISGAAGSVPGMSNVTSALGDVTGGISNATGISQQALNSGFGNAALSAGKAALTGNDPLQAAINSGVNSGLSAGVSSATDGAIKNLPIGASSGSSSAPNLSGLSAPQMSTYMGALNTPGTTPAAAYAAATAAPVSNGVDAQPVAPTYTRSGNPITQPTTAGSTDMTAPEIYSSIVPTANKYVTPTVAPMATGPSDLQLSQSIANGTPVAAAGQEAINANLAGYKDGGLAHFADGGATTDSTNGAPPANSPLQDLFSEMQKNLKDSQPVFAAHPQSMLSISRPPANFGAQSSASPNMPVLNLDQARHFQFHAQGGGIHTDPKIEGVSGLGSLHEGGNAAYHYHGAPDDHKPEFITGATGYHVQGKGTGQSDDIPAMLADGEYVFDADTVSALGDGSNKAGAEVLNKMREALRAHKRSAPNDKIPPPAKTPLEYMKKALKG